MVMVIDKKCEYCGKMMLRVTERRKYCSDACRKRASRIKAKIHYKSRKEESPIIKRTPYYGDISQCITCLYRTTIDGNLTMCNYMGIMGHSRPCEPSPDCTVYKKSRKRAEGEEIL